MKRVIILLALCLTLCFNWVNYDACDKEWADEPSWARIHPLHEHDTICFLENQTETGEIFDTWILTALASGLTSYGVQCHNGRCTPKNVNDIVAKYNDTSYLNGYLGIKSYSRDLHRTEISDRLNRGDQVIIGVSYTQSLLGKSIKYALFITAADYHEVRAINQFGQKVLFRYFEIENFYSFKLMPEFWVLA